MNTMRWTTVVTALALSAAPVAGQMNGGMRRGMSQEAPQTCPVMGAMGAMMGGGGPMMGQGMHGGGMMMGTPGSVLLGAADELGLNADQKQKLEDIQKTATSTMTAQMQVAMTARQKAAEATSGDAPDMDAYGKALRQAADAMVQAHLAMAQASVEARAVLTPEQRQNAESRFGLGEAMRCGMGMMGMGPGGMHGGSPR